MIQGDKKHKPDWQSKGVLRRELEVYKRALELACSSLFAHQRGIKDFDPEHWKKQAEVQIKQEAKCLSA